MNNFYKTTGALILGTRMKRLSEKFLQEINLVYKDENMPFEPSWFPIFYLLRKGEGLSLTDIAMELDVSHSAISQMVQNLKKKGLLDELADPYDGRRKNICLSKKGQALLAQVKPIWWAMEQAVTEILGEENRLIFFKQIGELEKVVQNNILSRKIISNIPASRFDLIKIDYLEKDSLLHSFLLQHHLPKPLDFAFVGKAVAEQKMVGMISFGRMEDTEDYLLQELYVQNGFRRKGIGTQLLNWAMNELKWTGRNACIHLKRVNPSILQLILKEGKTFKVLGNR